MSLTTQHRSPLFLATYCFGVSCAQALSATMNNRRKGRGARKYQRSEPVLSDEEGQRWMRLPPLLGKYFGLFDLVGGHLGSDYRQFFCRVANILKDALNLIGTRTLDHVVVGCEGCVSLAERGYL